MCNGVPFAELGDAIDPGLLLPGVVPLPRTEAEGIVAEITWVDRYGNCQLNVGPDEVESLGSMMSVVMTTASGERTARAASVVKNFAEIGGGIGLVIDSFGMLAICANRGSASDELNIAVGDAVTLSALDETAGVTTNVELRRSPKST